MEPAEHLDLDFSLSSNTSSNDTTTALTHRPCVTRKTTAQFQTFGLQGEDVKAKAKVLPASGKMGRVPRREVASGDPDLEAEAEAAVRGDSGEGGGAGP